MRKIAITGGLASGKSTVCLLLKKAGGYVVDADQIVHDLLSSDPEVQKKVVQLLGTGVLIEKTINRKKIASMVFSNPEKRKGLEAILHPAVKKKIEEAYAKVSLSPLYSFFVAEVPLLYEAQMESLFDIVVFIETDKKIAKQRFIERSGSVEADFVARTTAQMPVLQKKEKSHVILTNNGNLEQLQLQVTQLANELKENLTS